MTTLMGDEELQEAFQGIILNMSTLLNYMNQILLEQGHDIDALVSNMEITVDRLRNIVETIDKGEGTVGQLLKNDELYLEMKDLIREIKLHPWRLLKKDTKGKKKFLFF